MPPKPRVCVLGSSDRVRELGRERRPVAGLLICSRLRWRWLLTRSSGCWRSAIQSVAQRATAWQDVGVLRALKSLARHAHLLCKLSRLLV
eukprot:5116-Heterococcus_DN1.PRE.1